MNGKHIYLDYAASTPVDQRVERAMRPYFLEQFGNPGSLHFFGQRAIAAVDASREAIATTLGVDFREVLFTGSATEANNLALRGAVAQWRLLYPLLQPRIIISAIEHESVFETARDLERAGAELVIIPVDRNGLVDTTFLANALNERTVIISIMYANNEIGVVQSISDIAAIIKEFKKETIYPLFHTDAVQAFQYFDCTPALLGVDIMTLSAHKLYGPKGMGLLYSRTFKKPTLVPIITGGGQEFGMRSGTENVPLIGGFSKAIELANAERSREAKRVIALREYFLTGIKKIIKKAEINGVVKIAKAGQKRITATTLPNILNIYFPGHRAEDLVVRLDLLGVAVSSGSACRSRAMETSYVIEALGFSKERAASSIRFSFGRGTTKRELDITLKILKKILD